MSRVTVHEDVIPEAICEAVAKIVAGIDLERAKDICRQHIGLAAVDGVEIREAVLGAHDGQPAVHVRLGFSGTLSLVLDFKGNCASVVSQPAPGATSPEQKLVAASDQAAQAHQQF